MARPPHLPPWERSWKHSQPRMPACVPTLTWVDDSSEVEYTLQVFDAFGTEVWNTTVPAESGTNPEVVYDGTALVPGMFYQFRVTSIRQAGMNKCPISTTEDLKGVFYLP